MGILKLIKKYVLRQVDYDELKLEDEEVLRFCNYCENPLTGLQRRFCCDGCSHKWRYHNIPRERRRVLRNTKRSYDRRKNNPEFKRRQRETTKRWQRENKERYNQMIYGYIRKKQDYRIKNKLCIHCGKKLRIKNFKSCSKCRRKKNLQLRRSRRRNQKR